MWLFFNDSFLSIVEKPGDADSLTVRGRIAGDIESVFPSAEIEADAGTDYRFRAKIAREEVARVIAERVSSISYSNFKGSVRDHRRHDAYLDIWRVMYEWQEEVR